MNDESRRQELAAILRAARKEAGLSLRELEAQSGVPRTVINRLETEGAGTGVSLLRVAQALELRASDLFLKAGRKMPKVSINLPAMLRAEYDLPPEAIEQIQRNIEEVAKHYKKNTN